MRISISPDFASDTLEIARAKFDFLRIPRSTTVSGEIGLVKPDIEICCHHRVEFDLSPGHTLFIDDSRQNVEAAIVAG